MVATESQVKRLFALCIVGVALVAAPVSAQEVPRQAQQGITLVGLPIYSSDGEKVGEVVQVGLYEGQKAVVAKMEPAVGVGAKGVLIPDGAYTEKTDRLELPLTSSEVKDTLSKD